MTLVDIALLNAALAERDAAREENARLRAAVGRLHIRRPWDVLDFVHFGQEEFPDKCVQCRQPWPCPTAAALAVPDADDGAERGAR